MLCYQPKLNFGRAKVADGDQKLRKVEFTDFVKRATANKMQLTEFRFHKNSKVHSLLLTDEIWKLFGKI